MMDRVYLIGVDLGTSVVKTSLFDHEGRRLADATRATAQGPPSARRTPAMIAPPFSQATRASPWTLSAT